MKNIFLLLFTISILSISCSTPKSEEKNDTITNNTIETDEIKLTEELLETPDTHIDYQGVYEGIIPCSDCKGTKTIITLEGKWFKRYTAHLGLSEMPFIEEGNFSWEENGTIINLGERTRTPVFYLADGDFLHQLNPEKQRMQGNDKNKYSLKKQLPELDS